MDLDYFGFFFSCCQDWGFFDGFDAGRKVVALFFLIFKFHSCEFCGLIVLNFSDLLRISKVLTHVHRLLGCTVKPFVMVFVPSTRLEQLVYYYQQLLAYFSRKWYLIPVMDVKCNVICQWREQTVKTYVK